MAPVNPYTPSVVLLASANNWVDAEPMTDVRPDCPEQHCDCSHPAECLFSIPGEERPSYLIVWIAAAVILAVVIIVLVWIA